jgi:hypothetical protein
MPLTKLAKTQWIKETQTHSFRLRRNERWNNLFNADELFAAGILMAAIFLFNRSIECKIAHFLFFCLLVWLSGGKYNPFATMLFMASVVFFHLLAAPYGKVLFHIGPLRITQGSLLAGAEKAITMTGLLLLSRTCIKSDLRFPGTIGSLLGESLRMFELMRQRKGIIRRGNIISGIDRMMLEMETINTAELDKKQNRKRSISGIFLLSAMVLLTAAIGAAGFLL